MSVWLRTRSEASKEKWLREQKEDRSYFAKEPNSNADKLPVPPWFKQSSYFATLKTKYSDWQQIAGDYSRALSAQYFVIHDTAGTDEYGKGPGLTDPEDRTATRGIHLWLGPKNRYLGNDWHEKGYGTKMETRAANHHLLHIELVRDKTRLSKPTFYSNKQYQMLAHAYVCASVRRGTLLTTTSHNEVDRACVQPLSGGRYTYGHHDPEKFDLGKLYGLIADILGLPASATFGIEPHRVNGKNLGGQYNSFINYVKGRTSEAMQYGPVLNATGPNNDRGKHKKMKLKYGWYYVMPVYKTVGGVRYLPRDVPN